MLPLKAKNKARLQSDAYTMIIHKRIRSAAKAIGDLVGIVFRALGLTLATTCLKSLRNLAVGKGYGEPTKVAICKNRTTALARALIHIAPVGVALWEISLNWNGYYFGATMKNLAYYQFGAKIHEMTAQASLATIVFSYVRYEMSLGEGLPFGALFSGLHVTQVSYLWSMEYWGSLRSKHLSVPRKIGMISIILVAIILAATIGPSSAILLIPRLEYWPAGTTSIWLNATAQDLWPDRLNGSVVSSDCSVSDELSITHACPSTDWPAIRNFLRFGHTLVTRDFQFGMPVSYTPPEIRVSGQHSYGRLYVSRQYGIFEGPGYDDSTSVTSTQLLTISDALSSVGTLWGVAMQNVTTRGHGSILSRLDAVHTIKSNYYQPYTAASCERDIIRGPNDTAPVAFPLPPASGPPTLNMSKINDEILPNHAFIFPGISRKEIFHTPGLLTEYRLRWIELPQDPFNNTAIGAIVLLPRPGNQDPQNILVCNIGAGWGSTILNVSTFTNSPSEVISVVTLDPEQVFNSNSSNPRRTSSSGLALGTHAKFKPQYFPQRPITLSADWAAYLNPSIRGQNTTVFNALMQADLVVASPKITANLVLSSLVASGLSKVGSGSTLQGQPRQITQADGAIGLDGGSWFSGKKNFFNIDPEASKDWVELRVYTTINGYAYSTDGTIQRLAIAFLLIYCLAAVAHIIYAGISGVSSTCWDSISEVTALAINSTPTALLRNTCAGIMEINTFKIPVRILAMPDEEGEGEHLELVFGSQNEKDLDKRVIKPDRVYGTMPADRKGFKVL